MTRRGSVESEQDERRQAREPYSDGNGLNEDEQLFSVDYASKRLLLQPADSKCVLPYMY